MDQRSMPAALDHRSAAADRAERRKVWYAWTKHIAKILLPTGALVGLLLVIGALNQPTRTPSRSTVVTSEANRLSLSLNQYKIDTGRYPNELIDLIPSHLDRISPTTAWKYASSEDHLRYTLTFVRSNERITLQSDGTVVATTQP